MREYTLQKLLFFPLPGNTRNNKVAGVIESNKKNFVVFAAAVTTAAAFLITVDANYKVLVLVWFSDNSLRLDYGYKVQAQP